MGILKIEGVTHWSIPVNNLEEAEAFYGDLLGLEARGRLGNSGMSCFNVGDHNILLCQLDEPTEQAAQRDPKVHHSFTVTPETFEAACRLFHERSVPVDDLVYRERSFFTGRELYFFDPSGNRLELRDPTWETGMPTPAFADIG